MRLVNLTKDPLVLVDTSGTIVELPPDPRHIGIVGLSEHRVAGDDGGREFTLNIQYVKEIKGMPPPEDGTLFIVPVEVAMVLQERRDDIAFASEFSYARDADGSLRLVSRLKRVISRILP